MKNQIFVLSFIFCLLLGGKYSVYGQSEQNIADLSPTEKKKLVEDYIKRNGLDRHGVPEIIIIDAPAEVYGQYEPKGSTPKYDHDVIELYKPAFSSLGELEVTLRHELQHYWIDQGEVPEALEEEWSTLRDKSEAAFDFSQFKKELAKELIEQVAALAAHKVEEWFISQGILDETRVYEDPENARRGAEKTLQEDKKDLDEFWKSPKSLIQDSGTYKIQPVGSGAQAGTNSTGETEGTAAADNPHARMNMSGDYECVSGRGCQKSGTYTYDAGGSTTTTEYFPLTVTQQGAQITMKGHYTVRKEGYNNSAGSFTGGGHRAEYGGTATITGREFSIPWTTTIVSTGGKAVFRDFNGNIINEIVEQPSRESGTDTATIRILAEGKFELIRVDNEGKTNVWRYERN